jgi:nucleotide-binding universal stress UspA family protein
MTPTGVLSVVAVAWIAFGVASALVMARRGHSWFMWALLGTILGPLVLVLAACAIRDESTPPPPRRGTTPTERGAPGTRLLIGVDGSPLSETAARSAIRLFAPRPRQVTLAMVLEYEEARTPAGLEDRRRASEYLSSLARTMPDAAPDVVLLSGRAADALAHLARDGAYDVVAVAAKGRGFSRAILGSTASRLMQRSSVPVLVVGASVVEPHGEMVASSSDARN